MALRPTRFQLRIASVTLLAASALVIGVSFFVPLGSTESSTLNTPPPTTLPATQSSDDATKLLDLSDVTLRQPLTDAHSATSPSGVIAIDPTLGLRLIGTIIEPMHAYAVFSNSAGKTELKTVGERTDGASISAINPDSVTLQINGRVIVLHTVKPAANGVGGL